MVEGEEGTEEWWPKGPRLDKEGHEKGLMGRGEVEGETPIWTLEMVRLPLVTKTDWLGRRGDQDGQREVNGQR